MPRLQTCVDVKEGMLGEGLYCETFIWRINALRTHLHSHMHRLKLYTKKLLQIRAKNREENKNAHAVCTDDKLYELEQITS